MRTPPAPRRSRTRRWLATLAAGLAAGALGLTDGAAPSAAGPPAGAEAAGAALPLGHSGRWITDAAGRVVVLHGVNQVYKIPPYEPGRDGFGADDAAFLADNGFDAVRVGVIWAGVEPQPGVYDDGYLVSVAGTVDTLAAHGIVSILDFHQDLYNERFQGEGAPAWAVRTAACPTRRSASPATISATPPRTTPGTRSGTTRPRPTASGSRTTTPLPGSTSRRTSPARARCSATS